MRTITFLCCVIIFASCSHQKTELASITQSDRLIASNELILIADIHPLTKEDVDRLYRFYPKTLEKIQKNEKLHIQDIKNMTRAGLADDVIIYEIQYTRSQFYLTPGDEKELSQAGVSKAVISAMKDTIDVPISGF